MKPTLFWTLKRHSWTGGWEPMRVTTEKASRLYGTGEDEVSTHCKTRDCRGRFASLEEAKAVMGEIRRSYDAFEPSIKALQAQLIRAQERQRAAVDAVASGARWVDVKPKYLKPSLELR